jgi:thiol-disulfide isomerase/thioredoxin
MKTWLNGLVSTVLLGACALAHATGYTLPDLDGRPQSLDQYRGKWVIVNYWATWCGTCRKELPDLIALHEKHHDSDIVVVGINFEEIGRQELKAYVAAQGIPYPVLRTVPVRKTPLGPVPALPTTYILDPAGNLVAGEVGLIGSQAIEDYIASRRTR